MSSGMHGIPEASPFYYFISDSIIEISPSPNSRVELCPPISGVRIPLLKVILIPLSMSFDPFCIPRYFSIMDADRIAAVGFAMPLPAMSGADP